MQIPDSIPTVLLEVTLIGVAIPFLAWLVVSVFNQKTEIALLKEAVTDIRQILSHMLEKKRR